MMGALAGGHTGRLPVNAGGWLELATEHAPQDQLDFDRSARSPRQIAAMSQSRSEYFAEHATTLEGELSTVLEMVMSSRPADPALAIAKLLTERRQAALARPEAAAIDAAIAALGEYVGLQRPARRRRRAPPSSAPAATPYGR